MPIPATKVDSLLGQLHEIAVAKTVDENALKLIEIEAKSVIEADPSRAYVLLGAIACIRGDLKNMHKHHKNAINLAPGSHETLGNYAVSLGLKGLHKEALSYWEQAIEAGGPYERYLELTIESALACGNEAAVDKYLSIHRELYGDIDIELSGLFFAASLLCEADEEEIVPIDESLFARGEELLARIEADSCK